MKTSQDPPMTENDPLLQKLDEEDVEAEYKLTGVTPVLPPQFDSKNRFFRSMLQGNASMHQMSNNRALTNSFQRSSSKKN